LEGAAEAAAILAKGNAEAAAMQSKADAFAVYGEAALLDLLLRVLPQVVEAASAPVAAIDKITVISTDGASALTKTVAANVAQGIQLGTDLTGIDLTQLLSRLSGVATASTAAVGNGKKAVAAPPATDASE
jgi:flotillin